jgi:hypothetical protein
MKLRLIKAKQSFNQTISNLQTGQGKMETWGTKETMWFWGDRKENGGEGNQRRLYGQRDGWVICFTEEQLKEIRTKEYGENKMKLGCLIYFSFF